MTQPILHVEPGALDHVPAGIVLAIVKRWGLSLEQVDGRLTLKRNQSLFVQPLTDEERQHLYDALRGDSL